MVREVRIPRPNYRDKIERLGLTFHTLDGKPYWCEEAAYRLESREIEELESATNELHEMCLAAVEHVIGEACYEQLGIPKAAWEPIAEAWEADPPAIYGRFDLVYDGATPPKLLEYNADTPTSLLEAAVIQWHWLCDMEPDSDQFNSIWEALVAKWASLIAEGYFREGRVDFACMEAPEDLMTTAVMMDTAQEAGLQVNLMHLTEIGWDHLNARFVNQKQRPIQTLFKLYPWEWLVNDPFGTAALKHYRDVQWIEPIWKMILSNKAILAILWELFPEHPNLLPAYLDDPRDLKEFVRKPILGREGANVSIFWKGGEFHTDGPYEHAKFVYQQFHALPVFEGNHALLGSWVIDGEARGIGIRESDGMVTEDCARFVPHYFRPVDSTSNIKKSS